MVVSHRKWCLSVNPKELAGSNRKEMEEILKYIGALCHSAAGTIKTTDLSEMKPIEITADLIKYDFSNCFYGNAE